MTAPELKPCPFCGGEAILFKGHQSTFACCADLRCPGWTLCRATPEIWNTRAPDADLDAAVGAALAEAAKAAWPHDWQPDHILSRTNYMLFCAAKNILALRPTAITALDRAKREARVEVVAALQELTEVAERAIRLSREHSDFKLYGMEPMWQAIAAARALIEKEGKP